MPYLEKIEGSKMKNMFLSILVLSTVLQSNELKSLVQVNHSKSYTINIEVEATKLDGKSWDIAGGTPDILINIDGEIVPFDKQCKNSYKCEASFVSKKLEWYIEIYDKDLKTPDLIGKGKCKPDSECKLGRAKIKITN